MLGRAVPGQHERDALASRDREPRCGVHVLPLERNRRCHRDRVRAGHRADARPGPSDPWHRPAVVESEPQPELHADLPLDAFDDADDGGVSVPVWHEVDQPDEAVGRAHVRLQDERAGPIATVHLENGCLRPDGPVSVVLRAEQRRETGSGVEAGQAQPVDGTVRAHERGGVAVADHGVVLQAFRHAGVPHRHATPGALATAWIDRAGVRYPSYFTAPGVEAA